MDSSKNSTQKKVIVLDKKYSDELNRDIYNQAGGYGPSLISLHSYGPSGILVPENERIYQINYDRRSIDIIKNRREIIDDIYLKAIRPKIPDLIAKLTDNKGKFYVDRFRYFRVRPFDDIRNILKNSIDSSLDLDGDTIRELFSNDKMNVSNEYVRFYYDRGNKFLYSMRVKQSPKSKEKYKINYEKLSPDEKELFPNFLSRVSHDPLYFWENNNHKKYLEIFGKNICDLMLGDYFGFKVVDLNNSRGKERLEQLGRISFDFSVRGFNTIEGRYDDHRNRLLSDKKPGGIHYTFTDKGLSNFPIEVQYLDLESMIRDMFGPKKHALYTFRGKKLDKKKVKEVRF